MKKINLFILSVLSSFSLYGAQTIPIPKINFAIGSSDRPEDLATALQVLVVLTILTLAPSIIMLTTSFVRITIVLHFVRQALGLQQMPPNQMLIGLSLFLTFFIMQPTMDSIMTNGINPYMDKKISQEQMLRNVEAPLKSFMLKQTRSKDLELFLKVSKSKKPASRNDVSIWVVIPAYIISELTRGFEIGILIFIPFIVVDMIIATILMSLGMMMLPPAMISLPFKLLLFVMIDGWNLIVEALVRSFG